MTADTDTGAPTPASVSLKGILNTNDDPFRCAICLESVGCYEGIVMNFCCGKAACYKCDDAGTFCDKKAGLCLLCNATNIGTIGPTKKQAKKGHAWAQNELGRRYANGKKATQSFYDAVRWYRKAAVKGNPFAMLNLSVCYRFGEGCSGDLVEAREWAQKASNIDDHFKDGAINQLSRIGIDYYQSGKRDEAQSTLSAILEMDTEKFATSVATQYLLGRFYYRTSDDASALKWFSKCVMQGEHGTDAAGCAMDCCWQLQRVAEAKFWFSFEFRTGRGIPDYWARTVSNLQQHLRHLRQCCKVCSAPLDRSNRKLCKAVSYTHLTLPTKA